MRPPHYSSFLLPLFLTGVLSDYLGPRYPPPSDLSSDQSLVAKSWNNLSSTLKTSLTGKPDAEKDPISALQNITFSVGMFSLHDEAAEKLQYHYTSAEVENSPHGTHKVDADSIYRVASVTKLFTVLAGMVEFNNGEWDRPLTDFVPELAEYARNNPGEHDPVHTIQWDKVTLAALGAQMAGVPRGGYPYEDLIIGLVQPDSAGEANPRDPLLDPASYGLPPVNFSNPAILPPCSTNGFGGCTGSQFARAGEARAPIFLPWTSPAYANNGFMLLGVALANITGKSYEEIYRDSIFDPLRMASSSTKPPNDKDLSRSVIPKSLEAAAFVGDFGVTTTSGGVFSTTNDLAKFGIGIINSTLLPDDVTRKWIKPVTHTARLDYSVGRPWEIARYTHPNTGVITDMYTKSGDSGLYSSFIVILPDYDAGFSILTAGTSPSRTNLAALLGDLITEAILPALEGQAAVEVGVNFAGTYTSKVEGLNSSLCLTQNKTTGDLTITSWVSNSTDMMGLVAEFISPRGARLMPSVPNTGNGELAFRAQGIASRSLETEKLGPFLRQWRGNADWLTVDNVSFGGIGFSLFIFEVGDEGKATSVSPAITKATLERGA
ncbi:Fc.00g116230.m01.CDS01 [Cosmosporella sp. VM-42]